MKIIEGLSLNQAIKIGDNYVVSLPSGLYDIGGKRVTINGYNPQQITIAGDSMDDIWKVAPEKKIVDYYINEETEQEYTTEERNEASKEMGKYLDEDGDYYFPDLDTEYELRKKLDPILKAKPVYKTIPEEKGKYSDVELVGEMIDTGSDFIKQSYVFGKAQFSSGGIFSVSSLPVMSDQVKKTANKLGLDYDIPNYGGIRFVKVGGAYIFPDKRIYTHGENRVFSVLGDALAYEEQCRKTVDDLIRLKTSNLRPNEAVLKDIASDVSQIQTSLSKLRVYSRAESDKRILSNKVNKLLEKLVTVAKED